MVRRVVMRTPTFTETVQAVGPVSNTGGVFAVRMDDIPQLPQYQALYRQYRINWVKVILVPILNSYEGNQNPTLVGQALPRICYAINDTPQVVPPVNEQTLLEDNGCKIKTLVTKWSCSFRPTPNLEVADAGNPGSLIPLRLQKRPWLNFASQGNLNPLHYGISYFISQSLGAGAAPGTFGAYYKINFSLRDPQ